VEGYPGLVVHGPLTSTLLIDFARDHNPGRTFLTYTTQARAPLFDHAPFELRGRPTPDGHGAELWAGTPNGTTPTSAQATFAERRRGEAKCSTCRRCRARLCPRASARASSPTSTACACMSSRPGRRRRDDRVSSCCTAFRSWPIPGERSCRGW